MEGIIQKIKCIFFSEFHPTAGPKIFCQYPTEYVTKEDFDSVHQYIITKTQLKARVITINTVKHKIVGCPVCIDNPKYARNALMFNLCLLLDANASALHYEVVVKKLASYLTTLEMESGFLSNEETKSRIPSLLQGILEQINSYGSCLIPINDSTTIHLMVVPIKSEPGEVDDHMVPIMNIGYKERANHWDLATQQLLPYIDGFKHVARIAAEGDMDINIVKVCIQNLVHYGIIQLISIFQYTNVYVTTPNINKLAEDESMQRECVEYIAKPHKIPSFCDVFAIYCGLRAGITVRDVCSRYNPHSLGIDERKLVQYGLLKGLIRHLKKYPIKLPNEPGNHRHKHFYRWFNGCHSFDEICCKTGLSYQELDEKVENDPSIVVCWK